jgi:hypothetical protein
VRKKKACPDTAALTETAIKMHDTLLAAKDALYNRQRVERARRKAAAAAAEEAATTGTAPQAVKRRGRYNKGDENAPVQHMKRQPSGIRLPFAAAAEQHEKQQQQQQQQTKCHRYAAAPILDYKSRRAVLIRDGKQYFSIQLSPLKPDDPGCHLTNHARLPT